MPRKKANTIIESGNEKEENKLAAITQKPQAVEDKVLDSETDKDIEKKASELAFRIARELYRHYGAGDSHTNKNLYHSVMFEVAMLSGKPLSEVINNWPKFDIFSILDKIKETVFEELKNEPSIMYQMFMNSKMIADRILAKVIVNNMI
jgi:hypothetical protein